MMALQDLLVLFHPGDSETSWIGVDDFLEFIRRKKTEEECQRVPKVPKRSNIIREVTQTNNSDSFLFQKTTTGTQLKLNRLATYKYLFHHSRDLTIFTDLCNDICCKTFKVSPPDDQSCFRLYESVSGNDLKSEIIGCCDVEFDESKLCTLEVTYKALFSYNKWQKICWFEYQFLRSNFYNKCHDQLETTNAKWSFYNTLIDAKKVCAAWLTESKMYANIQTGRFKAARIEDDVCLYASFSTHRPEVMEKDILDCINNLWPEAIEGVAIVDNHSSRTSNTFDMYIGHSKWEGPITPEEMLKEASRVLWSKHSIALRTTNFLEQGSFDQFREHGKIKRFLLRDACIAGSVRIATQIVSEQPDNTSSEHVTVSRCPHCFNKGLPEPLSLSTFSVLHEWHLQVPVFTQVMFEEFVNKRMLNKQQDVRKLNEYIKHKLEKLYFAMDILLNVQNMTYHGIMPQAFSQELFLYHRNVSNVFSVTGRVGLTTSLTAAETKMAEEALSDKLYWFIYIKEHKLAYMTLEGIKEAYVTLRDCHLMIMLDNLVRLTHRSDPTPGENRSGQKCLLPITYQALPMDSLEASLWHDPDICNGSNSCLCKEPTKLSSADIEDKILNLLPPEADVWQRFHQLSIWGNKDLWRFLTTSETLQNIVHEAIINDPQDICVEQEHSSDTDNFILPCTKEEDEQEDEIQNLDKLLKAHMNREELTAANGSDDEEESTGNDLSDLAVPLELDISSIPSAPKEQPSVSGLTNAVSHMHLDCGTISESGSLEVQDSLSLETTSEVEDSCENHFSSRGEILHMLNDFGIEKYSVDSLLTLHPPPASGRDDDVEKLYEILSEILSKSGYIAGGLEAENRLLLGADHKIGKNLIILMKRDKKFLKFLPEFPPLHLRKSKINTFFSAYKDTGIFHVLMYMRDDGISEWSKLADSTHIDAATRTVRRIALGLQMAFLITFTKSLPQPDAMKFVHDLSSNNSLETCNQWHDKFEQFLIKGCRTNATFALHKEWLDHCNEVVAVSLAERMGGKDGYNLLLAAVKKALPFGFLNGAGAYSPYTVDLLHEHYSCGPFHQGMKMALFSTPIYGGTANHGLDTKREIGHQTAMKSFKPSSNVENIKKRLSRIDHQIELHNTLHHSRKSKDSIIDSLGWTLNNVDLQYVYRVAGLVLRQNGLSLHQDETPYNMYTNPTPTILSANLLDRNTGSVGRYLVYKYIMKEGICCSGDIQLPDKSDIDGPTQLVKRAVTTSGKTLKRTSSGAGGKQKSKEDIRKQKQAQKTKRNVEVAECLSSEMNTCQAMVTPACQKRTKQKSLYMAQALQHLVQQSLQKVHVLQQHTDLIDCIENRGLILSGDDNVLPSAIAKHAAICTVEFAGTKFKNTKSSGCEYLANVEQYVLKPLIRQIPQLTHLVICEEKYTFTPDIFKNITHQKRQEASKKQTSIAHLHTADEMVSDQCLNKEAVRATNLGKSLIGTYLAENVTKLNIKQDLTLIVDSELHVSEGCPTNNDQEHSSMHYEYCTGKVASPVKCVFNQTGLCHGPEKMTVSQCKGEAEMSQFDWVAQFLSSLSPNQAIVSVVTSGDIDAVPIHMFALSRLWVKTDISDRPQVYVILQKPNKRKDIYNITNILNLLQVQYNDVNIGAKVAIILCMGGNDFMPGFYGKSHHVILQKFVEYEALNQNLLIFDGNKIQLDVPTFIAFVKILYCTTKDNMETEFDVVREKTIKKKQAKKTISEHGILVNHPRTWLPPKSALQKLASLLEFQILYLETAGYHQAHLPDFSKCECLDIQNGIVSYNFGANSHVATLEDLLPSITDKAAMDMTKPKVKTPRKNKLKRTLKYTPQKGNNRKKSVPITSTPKK